MKIATRSTLLTLAAGAMFAGHAYADCVGATVTAVRDDYEQARTLEGRRDNAAALAAYLRAQRYTCAPNPVEKDAAERAARLSLPLAKAAEAAGNLDLAFEQYESGGHFAAADRVLMSLVRSRRDDLALYDRAVGHFENRALPTFAANMRIRLAVTGSYTPDAEVVASLRALPGKRAADALAREARRFDPAYLRAVIDLERRKAFAPGDIGAMQQALVAQQEFAATWSDDPLATSRRLLMSARQWAQRVPDPTRAAGLERRIELRYADRAHTLIDGYSAAPSLLAAARDYFLESQSDRGAREVATIAVLARRIADRSLAAGRYLAAADYYEVANDHEAAAAAREEEDRATRGEIVSTIEAARRQAEAMARAFAPREQG